MSDVMIEADRLGKRYGTFVALHDSSFELRRGEILGFLGPNGAGKSTTMKILTCFIAPTTGTARVNGCDIWEDPVGVRKSIGYLPESNALYTEMLALEYLEWVAQMRALDKAKAEKRIAQVTDEVGIGDVIGQPIRELSKGYKQRVGLAAALIHEPPILILDEPMSGLDPNQASEIRELIRSIGKERTIMLSTHNLDEVAKTCQRVLIVDKGRIVADDTPDALVRGSGAGGPRYRVIVQSSGDGGYRASGRTPKQVFGGVAGIEAVRELPSATGEQRLELTSGVTEDLRAEVFKAAVEANLILLGLETKTQNLEQVFRDLTQTASAAMDEDDEELEDDEEYEDEEADDEEADDEEADDEEEEDEADTRRSSAKEEEE
ncbi:MAG: ABC transporter ATP-binding protein [Sandaracinaceae bacterium]